MDHLRIVILTSLFSIFAIACNESPKKISENLHSSIGSEKQDSTGVSTVIDLTKSYDDISLRLDDFAEDFKIIKLEAKNNSKIRYFNGFIGDKYIISVESDKILQFSSNGKFIAVIARMGRAPDEYQSVTAWDVDREEQYFVFHDNGKNYIRRFNLRSSKHESNIPFTSKGRLTNLQIINDTVISILPFLYSNYGYLYFYQSLNGKIIEGKKHDPVTSKGPWSGKNPVFKKSDDNSIFFQPSESDTVFKVSGTKIKPVISILIEKPQVNGGTTKGYNVAFLYEDSKKILLKKTGFEIQRTATSLSTNVLNNEFILFDKNSNKPFRITPFYHDYFGVQLDIPLISFNNDNQFVVEFQALKLKKLLKDALEIQNIPESSRIKLQQLDREISEFDNPILVTGKCKNNL